MSVLTENRGNSLRQLFMSRHGSSSSSEQTGLQPYDHVLLLLAIALLSIGLIVVTSASMPVADRLFGNPFHFAVRHGIYILLAMIAAMVTMQIPMAWWRTSNVWLLLLAVLLLIAVLLVGRTVNGSTRWLVVGPITVQAAEPAKLFFFCYLAGYLVRRYEEVTENIKGFIKPLIVFFALALLLLLQPDLGTVVVMLFTTIGLLFLAGAKLWQFFSLAVTGVLAVVLLIVFEEYRVRRITSFLDPWADPFGVGYQLTQSLMAYGRGDLFGQGLGNSLQKLEYLPEAHTDFIMAILAEELGFSGVVCVLVIMLMIVLKALAMGSLALRQERPFDAYLAYSIGIWFSLQTAVNVGASAGILPTKGLTFPLLSYGGSSMIVMSVAVAILLRIDFEMRVDGIQAIKGATRSKKGKGSKSIKQRQTEEQLIENHKGTRSQQHLGDPQMTKRLLVMAGGTGGHVFPGLAVADELAAQHWQIHWLGTASRMEAQIVPKAGYPISFIDVAGVRNNGITAKLLAPFKIVKAIYQAHKVIKQFKPDLVMGMGGFASGPGGVAAWLHSVPLIIHEQNAVPGLTNKLLTRIASKVFTGFDNTFTKQGHNEKFCWVGNPVRQAFCELPPKDDMTLPLHVLVVGGSLGAKALNQTVPEAIAKMQQVQVRHQTGAGHLDQVTGLYQQLNVHADIYQVSEFIEDMPEAYRWADIVICRAGALTVSEVAAAGVAAIFVPLPYAVDDHQTKNAQVLVAVKGAVLMPQKEMTAQKLQALLQDFVASPQKLIDMSKRSNTAARLSAAKDVAHYCNELSERAA